MKRAGLILLLTSFLLGCAVKKRPGAELYWATDCIEQVSKGHRTRCTGNLGNVNCQGVKVTLKKGCAVWTTEDSR